MFCPNCRTEYREGFTVCADCQIDLVESIMPEIEPEWLDLQEIAVIDNPAQMAFVGSILEEQGIDYSFKSGSLMNANMFADPAKLLVPPDQFDAAREILKEVQRSLEDENAAHGNALNVQQSWMNSGDPAADYDNTNTGDSNETQNQSEIDSAEKKKWGLFRTVG